MILAFYSVENSLGYERRTFKGFSPKDILELLQRLPSNEVRFYNTETYSWGTHEVGLEGFEADYNHKVLDGSWWCVVIR